MMRDPHDRDAIRAWIDAHRDALPRTLEELARLPMPYRTAVVRALPPTDREHIWRDHFAAFLGDASTLTDVQRDFVREAMADLPVLMADDLDAARARGKELEARIGVLFSRVEANRVFGSIGPAESPA